VQHPAPDPERVEILFPIPSCLQVGAGVSATIARNARAAAALERKRFHEFRAVAAAETERAAARGGGHGIAPDQQSLRAWPDASDDAVAAIFLEQIAIAIAEKAARTGAELHQAGTIAASGPFQGANFSLVI